MEPGTEKNLRIAVSVFDSLKNLCLALLGEAPEQEQAMTPPPGMQTMSAEQFEALRAQGTVDVEGKEEET